MPWDVTCPVCQRRFPITEARQPIGIECPKCDSELTVEVRDLPGEAAPQARVTVGYPPSASAYAALAHQHESDSANRRKLRSKPVSMAGVMLAGLGTLLLSVGGLGAAGYFLFTNLGASDSAAVTATPRTPPTTPEPVTPTPPTPNPVPLPDPVIPPPPMKTDKFDLRPVGGTIPAITVPNLAADTTIDLNTVGGRVGAITVGGAGRYLVMHFPEKGQLNVFDVSEGRFLGGVAIDRGDVKLTGGLSCVVASVPAANGKGDLRAYKLPGLEKRYGGILDLPGGVNAMAMGNRTDSPLLVGNAIGEVLLLDLTPTGFQEIDGSRKKPHGLIPNNFRALPDGTAFLTYTASAEPAFSKTAKLLTEPNRDWHITNVSPPALFPGPDGQFYGNFSAGMDRKGAIHPFTAGVGTQAGRTWFVPPITRSGDQPFTKQGFMLRIEAIVHQVTVPAVDQAAPALQNKPTFRLMICSGGSVLLPHPNTPTLQALPEFDGMFEANTLPKPILDQHFFLVPEAKVLIILSGDRTKLVIRKLNI